MKATFTIAAIGALILAIILICGCPWKAYSGREGLSSPQSSPRRTESSAPDQGSARIDDPNRRPGESKEDYWGRIADTQNRPVVFFGRVLDQDGIPLEGVEVLPKVRRSVSTTMRLAGLSEVVDGSPIFTDRQGLFTISGYRGFTVTFALHKNGYRSYGGGVNCQPGFTQPGFPDGYTPDRGHPVEYQMIRSDMPPNERVFNKKFRMAWNSDPIDLDLGDSIGHIAIYPSRMRGNPQITKGFDWTVKIVAAGFGLIPLEGNQPELRLAPALGYGADFVAGAKANDSPWLSGINRTFAIRTRDNRYGTLVLSVDSYDDESNTPVWITVYLGSPGMRNIDRK